MKSSGLHRWYSEKRALVWMDKSPFISDMKYQVVLWDADFCTWACWCISCESRFCFCDGLSGSNETKQIGTKTWDPNCCCIWLQAVRRLPAVATLANLQRLRLPHCFAVSLFVAMTPMPSMPAAQHNQCNVNFRQQERSGEYGQLYSRRGQHERIHVTWMPNDFTDNFTMTHILVVLNQRMCWFKVFKHCWEQTWPFTMLCFIDVWKASSQLTWHGYFPDNHQASKSAILASLSTSSEVASGVFCCIYHLYLFSPKKSMLGAHRWHQNPGLSPAIALWFPGCLERASDAMHAVFLEQAKHAEHAEHAEHADACGHGEPCPLDCIFGVPVREVWTFMMVANSWNSGRFKASPPWATCRMASMALPLDLSPTSGATYNTCKDSKACNKWAFRPVAHFWSVVFFEMWPCWFQAASCGIEWIIRSLSGYFSRILWEDVEFLGDPDVLTVLAGRKLSGRQGLCCSCRACAAILNDFECWGHSFDTVHFESLWCCSSQGIFNSVWKSDRTKIPYWGLSFWDTSIWYPSSVNFQFDARIRLTRCAAAGNWLSWAFVKHTSHVLLRCCPWSLTQKMKKDDH